MSQPTIHYRDTSSPMIDGIDQQDLDLILDGLLYTAVSAPTTRTQRAADHLRNQLLGRSERKLTPEEPHFGNMTNPNARAEAVRYLMRNTPSGSVINYGADFDPTDPRTYQIRPPRT